MDSTRIEPRLAQNSSTRQAAEVSKDPAAEHKAAVEPVATPPTVDHPAPVIVSREPLQATFEYDRQLRRVIITLRREDGEIVRQIPPQHAVQMLANVMDTYGRLLDERG